MESWVAASKEGTLELARTEVDDAALSRRPRRAACLGVRKRWRPPSTPLSSVDLPAPLGPIRHVSEPRATGKATWWTAWTAPKDYEAESTR